MADVFPILPPIGDLCVEMTLSPGELCIIMPGGAELCAQTGFELGDLTGIAQGLIGQLNAALMPLVPIFNILDVIKCIFDCIQAVPDAISNLSPKGIIDCIPNLAKSVDKLLKLLPPFSIPPMIKAILDVLITAFTGIKLDIQAQLRALDRILEAATLAASLGNIELQLAADCAQGSLDAEFQNKNAALGPLNRLIGLINFFMQLAGLGCIPPIAGFGALGQPLLDILDAIIALLEKIRALIPSVDIAIPTVPKIDCPP